MIGIDRNVGIAWGVDDIAITVAFDDLAITGDLSSRKIGSRGRKNGLAHAAITGAHFAKIVHAAAISGQNAAHALPHAVAFQRSAATRVDGFVGVHGSTINTSVLRTRIVVFRNVGIVGHCDRLARAVAKSVKTIAHGLIHEGRASRRKHL